MSKKFIKLLLLQVIFLLLSIMVFSIINYADDGNNISFIVMLTVLVPQALLLFFSIIKLVTLKKSVCNWFLIFIFFSEMLGIILLGLESYSDVFPIIGYSLLYILIAISWIVLTYQNGTWGKKYKVLDETKEFKETE